MNGGGYGYPFCIGLATSNGGAGGSGGGGRWGESGGVNSASNGSNPSWSASALAMEAAPQTQQRQLHQYPQHNPFINFNYTQQQTQSSAMGWPRSNASVPYSPFIPLSSGGSIPQSNHYHSNNSYSNNAMMNNASHGTFAASAGMPTNQPMMYQYDGSTSTKSMAYSRNAATLPPVYYSQFQHPHSSASSPPVQNPPSNNNNPDEFFVKDELRGFFAKGQRQDLAPFCDGIQKRRLAMSREIKKHDVLKKIWNRRVKGMGFTKGDSKVALDYINELALPSRQSSTTPSLINEAITSAKSTVNMLMNRHLSIKERQIVGCKDDLLADEDFVKAMRMLQAADVYCVPCDNGFTAISCQSTSCHEIMIVRSREDNQPCCKSCANKKHHAPIAALRNELNKEKRTAADSKTPHSKLNPTERKHRNQKKRNEKKSRSKRIEKLVAKLTKEVVMVNNEEVRDNDADDGDGESSKGEEFISNVKDMLDNLLQEKGRKELRDALKNILSAAMASLIEDDQSKQSNAKVDMEEVDVMVDHVVDNMENMSKNVSGKGKQCRFSPTTLALATAVYNTSPSAYREMKANSTMHLPGERHMQRVKAETKVKDGQTTKPYLTVKAMMKARKIEKFEGLLQCDEMKLLHGMAWNTQTGDAVGLADDMLDINSVIRRVFSEDGHTVEAAVYVNQWQFVAITGEGVEYFLLEHFFNDGSLTGETLLNQLEHVVKMCEEVNMKVSGLCFDAGGNNSRVFCMLQHQKKLSSGAAWLNEEDCSIQHTTDPTRRLFVWFCTTHVLKALRNQFLSSHPSGKKAFKDSNGTDLGWAFIEKLYDKLQAQNKESGGDVTNGVRLNAKAVSPNKGDKMNVSLAKIPFEWKTNAYAISVILEELGISAAELKSATEEARRGYPNKRSESADNVWSRLRHGDALEQALYLQRVYAERNKCDSGDMAAEYSSNVEAQDEDDDAEEFDDDDFDEEDDEHAYAELENDESDATAKSVRPMNNDATHDSLASDIASLLFMVHIQSLFHDLFMCKHEKITKDNCDIVEQLVKKYLSYFEEWKRAQMKRKQANVDGWEQSFLAHQTWKNMRHALCGFVHFSKYMIEQRGVTYVPMLLSNSSSLEARFSCQRRTKHDSATAYSSGVSNMTVKSARAQITNRCYLSEDCVEENGTGRKKMPNGYSLAKKQREETEAALRKVSATRKSINDVRQRRPESTWMFGCEQPPTQRAEIRELAAKLNQQIDTSVLDAIIGTKRFQQFLDLCHDENGTKEWIDKFVAGSHEELEPLFHKIMLEFLSYFEVEIYGSKHTPCFGISLRDYLVSDSFHNDVVHSHLKLDGIVCRKGSIMVIDAVAEIFLERVFTVISEMKVVEDDVTVTQDTPNFFKMLQNIVGAGISKARKKFCPLKHGKGPEYDLLGAMGLMVDDPRIDEDYQSKYYTQQFQIENQGMLSLVHPKFIPWSTKLLLFTIKLFSKRRMIRYRREAIKVGKQELLADKELFNDFLQAARHIMNLDDFDRCTLRKIYVRVSVFTFHAYTGEKWDRTFNGVKQTAEDTSTIQFRHLLKTQGSTSGSTNVQKKTAQTKKVPLSKLLGIEEKKKESVSKKRKPSGDDSSGSKRQRTTEDDMKKSYQQLFDTTVIPKLKELNFDGSKIWNSSMLNMEERCAFVFVHFNKFHKHKNKGKTSAEVIKRILKSEMEQNNSWSNTLRENTSHNSNNIYIHRYSLTLSTRINHQPPRL